MATNDTEDTSPRRRIMLRRARGGGFNGQGAGASSHSESLRTSAVDDIEPDEVEDAVDPVEMNRQVRERALMPRPIMPPARMAPLNEDEGDDTGRGDGRENPRARLFAVANAGSQAYSKEYRLGLLHRMLLRGISLDTIATELGVSISTVEKDRAELKRRLRESAKSLDINEIIGGQNAFYDDARAMSLRIASGQHPVAMKLAATRTALAAEADRTRFLNTAGVFDVLRFRRSEDGADLSDVALLMQRTDELLAGLMADEDAAPRPRVRRKRRGMSFDDSDASSSHNENQEL